MVELLDLLIRNLSLGTALVWFLIALMPWLRGLRTAPEKAFTVASLLLGVWGLADWVFQNSSVDIAILAVKVRMTCLVLSSLAFLYFGRWLARPRGTVDIVPLAVAATVIAIIWTVAVVGVNYTAGEPWVVREPAWFAVYQIQVGAFGGGLLYYIAWSLRQSSFASEASRKRLRWVLWVFAFGLVAWVVTNIYGNLTPGPGLPAASSYALLLGIPLLVAVFRIEPQRLRSALRRLLVTPARPTMAVLYHNSGHPIAQIVLSGGKELDAGSLTDLAQAVDGVLSKGLKSDPGSLRQMLHGDYHIVFERGDHVTMVAVLKGPPSEGLRSEMRGAVRDFEAIGGTRLETWETAATFSDKAFAILDEVLSPKVL